MSKRSNAVVRDEAPAHEQAPAEAIIDSSMANPETGETPETAGEPPVEPEESEQPEASAPVLKITDIDLSKFTTTSAKIRALDAAGFSRSAIAKHLGKLYQHVRNVLETPLKNKPVATAAEPEPEPEGCKTEEA